jgi:hypothetical protein
MKLVEKLKVIIVILSILLFSVTISFIIYSTKKKKEPKEETIEELLNSFNKLKNKPITKDFLFKNDKMDKYISIFKGEDYERYILIKNNYLNNFETELELVKNILYNIFSDKLDETYVYIGYGLTRFGHSNRYYKDYWDITVFDMISTITV